MRSSLSADFQEAVSRNKAGLLVGLTGILINGVIFVLELFSGLTTGSTTLMADAFHNSVDAISAVMTVVAFLIAGKPADQKHPFGLGRVEYLCSLFIGMVILGIGMLFVRSSCVKIIYPSQAHFNTVAFAFMLTSIPLKLLYCLLNRKYAQKVSSMTLTAASKDALADVVVLTLAAFSLLFTKLTGISVDGPLGLIVSGYILFSGYSVVKGAVESLIGKAPDRETSVTIGSAVLQAQYVIGAHDLMVHDYGPNRVIASIHAEVPDYVPLVKAHQAVEQVEQNMERLGIQLVIHIDPVAVSNGYRNIQDYRNPQNQFTGRKKNVGNVHSC